MLKICNAWNTKLSLRGPKRQVGAIEGNEKVGFIVQVARGKFKKLIGIIDADQIPLFNKGYIIDDKRRSGKKIKLKVLQYNEAKDRWEWSTKSASFFVKDAKGELKGVNEVWHHLFYYRDNRNEAIVKLGVYTHGQKQHRAKFKNDEEFLEYVAKELFEFNSVVEFEEFVVQKLIAAGMIA